MRQMAAQIVTGERPDHEDVAMRKIDETQNAIDHRIAQGDERVDEPQRQTVDELLQELVQGLIVSTYLNFPSLIVIITAGLVALRCSSSAVFPVTPSKSFVAAIASRSFDSSVVPDRLIA